MHGSADESRTLRARQSDLGDEIDRQPLADIGTSAALLVRTVAVSSYPTTAGVAYGVQALDLSVSEAEGATPTLTVLAGKFFAINLGSNIPPVGTSLLVELVQGKYVFVY